MKNFMLDTNMCIYLIKRQPIEVARRFAELQIGDVVMSAITYAELSYGVQASNDPVREKSNLEKLIEAIPVSPFDHAASEAYGPVREATKDSKRDQLDKLIAAHAISLGATLVTNNMRDFAKYPGLQCENWLPTAW